MGQSIFAKRMEKADGVDELFALVKDAVRETMNKERAGLMLGLSDLGIAPQGFIGGYHQAGSNAIILNSTVLRRISDSRPDDLKPYAFSVLLHEYLHSLGVMDESQTYALTHAICKELFGDKHPVTKISKDLKAMTKEIMEQGPVPPGNMDVSFIDGFDSEVTSYIG